MYGSMLLINCQHFPNLWWELSARKNLRSPVLIVQTKGCSPTCFFTCFLLFTGHNLTLICSCSIWFGFRFNFLVFILFQLLPFYPRVCYHNYGLFHLVLPDIALVLEGEWFMFYLQNVLSCHSGNSIDFVFYFLAEIRRVSGIPWSQCRE